MMQKHATSGAAWRKTREEGLPVTFPSGKVAALRNVNLASLLAKGIISDALTPIVAELLNGGKAAEKLKPEQLFKAQIALQEAVCKLAFVNPRIVDEPQADDEISIDDVAHIDQEFALALLQTPVERLAETFRQTETPHVESVSEGEAVPDAS
jgi:hypothetical protein